MKSNRNEILWHKCVWKNVFVAFMWEDKVCVFLEQKQENFLN